MKVFELVTELKLQVFAGEQGLENEITGGYVSDLLSDVMGFATEGQVWITLQTHQNVLAVASLKDLAAIIIVKGYTPEGDTIAHSNREGVPLLGTTLPAFEVAGRLYRLLCP